MLTAAVLALSLSTQLHWVCVTGTLTENLKEVAMDFGVSVVYDYNEMQQAGGDDQSWYCPMLPVTVSTAYKELLAPVHGYFEWVSSRMIGVYTREPHCEDSDDPVNQWRSPPCLPGRK